MNILDSWFLESWKKRRQLSEELNAIVAEFMSKASKSPPDQFGVDREFDQKVQTWSDGVADNFSKGRLRRVQDEIGEWLAIHKFPPGGGSEFRTRVNRAKRAMQFETRLRWIGAVGVLGVLGIGVTLVTQAILVKDGCAPPKATPWASPGPPSTTLPTRTPTPPLADTLLMNSADAARDSTHASQTQAAIMGRQFEGAERPWLFAKVAADTPLTYGANGAELTLVITLNNTGHSPALAIAGGGQFLISQQHKGSVRRDELCTALQQRPVGPPELFPSYTVPPGATAELRSHLVSMPDELARAIDDERQFQQIQQNSVPVLFPRIVLCFDYQFPFARGEHHHTGYIFALWRRTATVDHPIAIEAWQEVPKDELVLVEEDSSDVN